MGAYVCDSDGKLVGVSRRSALDSVRNLLDLMLGFAGTLTGTACLVWLLVEVGQKVGFGFP